MIYVPTFNMSFFMPNQGMYTIDAIRAGIRTATSRVYPNEINLIKTLKIGQPVRFVRTNSAKQVVDSIIVFLISCNLSDPLTGSSYITLDNSMFDKDGLQSNYREFIESYWLEVEGWDRVFAEGFFSSNKDKELVQFRYSLYPPKYDYSPDHITELKQNEIFTFGSNTPNGRHGAGAAKLAVDKFGAIYGQAEGLQGQSYAIITTDLSKSYRPSVDIQVVKDSIDKFIEFAINQSHLTFLVTEIGCGLAGFTVEQVASMFKRVLLESISNIRLPKQFVRHIIVNSIESML